MPVKIRGLDLRSDRDELIHFLCENLTEKSDEARFDWLYLQNPCGEGRAWMAFDEAGRTIGVAAAFPRRVWLDRKPQRAWILADFCVAAYSRSLGPALLLQRECLKCLTEEEEPVWYDFPSRSMVAIYRRLGIPILGNYVRHVRLIRMDAKVQSYITNRPLARAVSGIGNLALRLRRVRRSSACNVEVTLHEDVFGEEFTEFDSVSANLPRIRGLRTAEYLNWRYLRNPLHRYRVVVAKRGRELLGYAVVEIDGSEFTVTDLQALEESATVPAILASIDHLARKANVDRVTASIMEGASLAAYLRRAGFYPRESVPVVACIGTSQPPFLGQDPYHWFFMQGDRES
jgi:hypothetical protein